MTASTSVAVRVRQAVHIVNTRVLDMAEISTPRGVVATVSPSELQPVLDALVATTVLVALAVVLGTVVALGTVGVLVSVVASRTS